MKSILNRSFHYTSSVETDLRKTFARVRREMRAKTHGQKQPEGDAHTTNVLTMDQRKKSWPGEIKSM